LAQAAAAVLALLREFEEDLEATQQAREQLHEEL